jgi:hypothetical protein
MNLFVEFPQTLIACVYVKDGPDMPAIVLFVLAQ